jgi:hypothetical protein
MPHNIVFAKTRYNYDSYTDFWTLVRLSGFETCFVDEIDWYSRNVYITAPLNGELKEQLSDLSLRLSRKADIVLWNLERPGGSGTLQSYRDGNQSLIDTGFLDCVIVSDKQLAKDTHFKYAMLGGHPGLGEYFRWAKRTWDVVHLMCYSNRRGYWFQEPGKPKADVDGIRVAPNGWGNIRYDSLVQSRFMLNIHQDEFPYIEPLRFILAACFGLPILTEVCADYYPYQDWHMAFHLHDAVNVIKTAIDGWNLDWEVSREMRQQMTQVYTFRAGIEAAI